MNLAPTLFHIRGIAIKMHITFLILIGYDVWIWRNNGIEGIVFGVLLTLLLFVCVTFHELGHALAAKSVGIEVNEILLLPFGGVAFLNGLPKRPWHDIWIAAAGPLANIIILAILSLMVDFTTIDYGVNAFMIPTDTTVPSVSLALTALFASNMMLVIFNLLPALPLDGGRIIRAVLIMIVGERRGSVYTAFVGHAIALVMAYIGIMSGSVMLPFIAYIIFRSGEHDRNSTRARTLLDTKRVDMAYNRNAIVLAPNARISTVVDHILTSYQPDFAILQGNTLLGIVTRNDVIAALEQSTQDEYVTAIMQREFIRVSHTATLDDVRTKLQSQNSEVAAVYRNDEYLGLVSITDIDEAMLVIESVQNHHFLRATTLP